MEHPRDIAFRTDNGRELTDPTAVRLEVEVCRDGIEVLSVWADCDDGSQVDLLDPLAAGALLYRVGLLAASQAEQDPDFRLELLAIEAEREPPAGMHYRKAV